MILIGVISHTNPLIAKKIKYLDLNLETKVKKESSIRTLIADPIWI